MQIQVWFSNDRRVDINLFDNSAVARWFSFYKKLSLDDYYSARTVEKFVIHRESITVTEKANIDRHWNIILHTLGRLSNMGYTVPFQLEPQFDRQQATLNLLHRFFTYNAAWYHDHKNDPAVVNPFDPHFELPKDLSYVEWHTLINNINSSVHFLEIFTELLDNKKFVVDQLPIVLTHVLNSKKSPNDFDPWLSFSVEDQQLNYTYFDSDQPLVILNQSILGKPVLQSFYDDDDLNAKDCTGRLGSFGGFFIDLNDHRKKIYQSAQFQNWIAKHNRDFASLPLEFPIGYVTNYEAMLQWINKDLTFKKILFVD